MRLRFKKSQQNRLFNTSHETAQAPALHSCVPAIEPLEARRLLSGTITIATGVVTVTGTSTSDTIAGGTNPSDSTQYYFLVQTTGQSTVEQFYAKSAVTGVVIKGDPIGSPSGTDNDFINLGGTDFGFTDSITGGGGSDTIIGAQSDNVINTGTGSTRDIVYGSIGDDSIVSNGSSDTLRSGGGHDTIQSNSGNNVLAGGKTGSELYAGEGWDTLRSGRGNATLHGALNSSVGTLMLGGFGNDFLDGRASSNDTMIAGSGLETIIAGTGSYFMDAGWDSYLILQGGNILPGSTGSDSIDGSLGENDTIVSSGGTPTLLGCAGDNAFEVNNPSANIPGDGGLNFFTSTDTVNPSGATTITIHLSIVIDSGGTNTSVVIPAGAGATPTGTSAARATDANGTIVFQTNSARTFTLNDFFKHWGVAFTNNAGASGIGQFIASPGSGHTLAMTVNGSSNSQFENYQVQNGDSIVITFTQ